MAENYILQVTAGSNYDVSKHQIVPVNQAQTVQIDNDLCSIDLNVRIQVRLPPVPNPVQSINHSLTIGLPRASQILALHLSLLLPASARYKQRPI